MYHNLHLYLYHKCICDQINAFLNTNKCIYDQKHALTKKMHLRLVR